MTAPARPGVLFSLLTIPARLVGRLRPDLAASVRADAATYGGSRAGILLVLALVAIGYPLVASAIHAGIEPQPEDEMLALALRPYFTLAYLESLPFMLAAAGVGAFSPALGVLLVAVFVPADLVAAAVSFGDGIQLQPPETAIPGRLVSDAFLWILAVEVPLRARRWSGAWRASRPGTPMVMQAAVYGGLIALLVYFWASTAGWLGLPVFTWSVLGSEGALVPVTMTAPTVTYGWILALGAAVLAVGAGLLGVAAAVTGGAAPPRSTGARGLAGELGRVALAAVLLSGLMAGWLEGILIVLGLIIQGPVLSRVLPRIPVPGLLARVSPAVRWAAALAVAGSVTWAAVTVIPPGEVPDFLLLAILIAVMPSVVRIVVEAGATRRQPIPSEAMAPAGLGAAIGAVGVAGAWLALPAVALAEDFRETAFLWTYPLGAAGLVAVAAVGIVWLNQRAAESAATQSAADASQSDASASSHENPDLEALLPGAIGGEALTTASMTGDGGLVGGSPGGQKSPLEVLGKELSDVSVAAGASSSVAIKAYRIDGVSGSTLLDATLAQYAQLPGAVSTQATIGGKSVTVLTMKETGETTYLYAHGDVLYAVGGPSVTDAALTETFQKLPPAELQSTTSSQGLVADGASQSWGGSADPVSTGSSAIREPLATAAPSSGEVEKIEPSGYSIGGTPYRTAGDVEKFGPSGAEISKFEPGDAIVEKFGPSGAEISKFEPASLDPAMPAPDSGVYDAVPGAGLDEVPLADTSGAASIQRNPDGTPLTEEPPPGG